MSLTRITFILLCSAVGLVSQGQFNTPSIDGNINPGEYGSHVEGLNLLTSGPSSWYCTWDDLNIYFALDGSNINEAALVYFDINPVIPVNGVGDVEGTILGSQVYDRTRFHHPIRSDFGLY
ncbi:MAG: hypothetical protein HKN45_01310, partial [Flavobacteriales bacterium]|nr:hypothetical protein [Flavobacteriales bacterium]